MPKVSAVITAKRRPVEVLVALRSILAQTYEDIEVLVVIDGPEPATEESLARFGATFASQPFQVIVNPVNVGPAESRNFGVRSTTGEYIAFLDDDDEWLPTKIEEQLRVAESLSGDHRFVGCRFVERKTGAEKIWPETLPEEGEPFSEYLYVHRGMLLPSVFFVSRRLMEDVPFTRGVNYIEDIDWMLKAGADPRTRTAVAENVLAIYNNFVTPGRQSRAYPWEYLYTWSVNQRRLFTPLAYACFIARGVVPLAKSGGASARTLLFLLSATLLMGSFSIRATFSFFLSVLFTQETKARGRRIFSRRARMAVPSKGGQA